MPLILSRRLRQRLQRDFALIEKFSTLAASTGLLPWCVCSLREKGNRLCGLMTGDGAPTRIHEFGVGR